MKTFDGMIIGNLEDKSALRNPIARALVRGFDDRFGAFVREAAPSSVHEVGCGEGRLTRKLAALCAGPVRATDLTAELFPAGGDVPANVTFTPRSIYDLDPVVDTADLVVCCEVLEHLDRPDEAIEALRRLGARAVLLSVPREPLWRALNIARGKYWRAAGNTPGHVNHWSSRAFVRRLDVHGFRATHVAHPLPWTMVLGQFDR